MADSSLLASNSRYWRSQLEKTIFEVFLTKIWHRNRDSANTKPILEDPPRSDLTSMLKKSAVAWIPQGKLQSLNNLCRLSVVDQGQDSERNLLKSTSKNADLAQVRNTLP